MTFKAKILLAIVSALLFVTASAAAEFTYRDYTKAPEAWKRGFVFGIARYMSTVAQPDEEPPYPVRTVFQRCLGSSTDALLAHHVEAYVAANPANAKGPMVAIVMRAFFSLCRADIERASPKVDTRPKMSPQPGLCARAAITSASNHDGDIAARNEALVDSVFAAGAGTTSAGAWWRR